MTVCSRCGGTRVVVRIHHDDRGSVLYRACVECGCKLQEPAAAVPGDETGAAA